MTRFTPPGEPVEIDVPDGHQIYHAITLLKGTEGRFECAVVARDPEDAERRVRGMLADPSFRGIGTPTTIEIFTAEEIARAPYH
jgi:hypothetical protein